MESKQYFIPQTYPLTLSPLLYIYILLESQSNSSNLFIEHAITIKVNNKYEMTKLTSKSIYRYYKIYNLSHSPFPFIAKI